MSEFYDQLPETTQKIAAMWRAETHTDMVWKKVHAPERAGLPAISDSRTQPFWVTCEFEGVPLYAVAKPLDASVHRQSPLMKMTGRETPAMDKVAFDIAYDLGVPVAPAALWENEDGKKYVLSLKPFAHTATPREVMLKDGWDAMETRLLRHLPELSAVSVFNIFVAQGDDHKENMLLNPMDNKCPCVFIDYDTSFQTEVAQNGRPRTGGLVDFFENPAENKMYGTDHILRAVDMDVVRSLTSKLSSLDLNRLAEIVEKIPDAYLPQEGKNRLMGFFETASQNFVPAVEKRFGGIHADARWPGVVCLSTRAELPKELKSALPKGDHLSDDEVPLIRNVRARQLTR